MSAQHDDDGERLYQGEPDVPLPAGPGDEPRRFLLIFGSSRPVYRVEGMLGCLAAKFPARRDTDLARGDEQLPTPSDSSSAALALAGC